MLLTLFFAEFSTLMPTSNVIRAHKAKWQLNHCNLGIVILGCKPAGTYTTTASSNGHQVVLLCSHAGAGLHLAGPETSGSKSG